MSLATDLQAVMVELLDPANLGNSAVFNHPDAVYDRTTGKTSTAPVTLPADIGGPLGVDPKLIAGGTIEESDQVIYVEASQFTTFDIKVGETTVTIDLREFAIVSMETFRVNNIDIGFELFIR